MFKRGMFFVPSLMLLLAVPPSLGLTRAKYSYELEGSGGSACPWINLVASAYAPRSDIRFSAIRASSSLQDPQQSPGAKASETKSAQALPTIEQILDKYVHAIGGKAAVEAATARLMKGTITVPSIGEGSLGTVEIYAKAPNKELTEIASSIIGNSRTGFNGTIAWQEENGKVKDLSGFSKREADFYLLIKLREIYPRIELKGKEKIGNAQAYGLEAPRGGRPKRWYFDTETGLLLRTEETDAAGKLINREDYEDHRAVDGVQIPFTTRRTEENGIEIIVKFSEVKHNVPIDDAKFDKPGVKSPDQTTQLAPASRPANAPGSTPQTKKQPDYSTLISELNEKVPQLMAQRNTPGVAVALIDGDHLVWAEGFGFTDNSKKVKVTADTLFNLQSVTKTYTASGFLVAATKGWLKLDDPLKKYLPTFKIKSRFGADEVNKITLRHLLSHRSGICREAPLGNLFDQEATHTFEEHVKSLSDSWLLAPVGERYIYSNPGMDLAGYVLGVRARKTFAQFMKDELFTPLGMAASTFDHEEALRNPSFARGLSLSGQEVPVKYISAIPSGGMYSSVRDMAKFVSFQLAGGKASGKQLISEAFLREMYTPQFAARDQAAGSGLGLGVERWKDGILLEHDGGGDGYSSWQAWIPKYQIGVVVLANRLRLTDFLPGEIGRQALLMMAQVKYGSLPPDKPPLSSDNPTVSLNAEQLHRLEGRYRLGTNSSIPDSLVTFKVEENSLFYIEQGGPFNNSGTSKVKVSAHSATDFTSDKKRFSFQLDKAGNVTGVLVQDRATTRTEFSPLNDRPDDPSGPNRPEWRAHLGIYTGKVIGLPIRATVSIKNGHLYVSWGGGGELKLTEYEPGLFFRSDGESVSFQGDRMLVGNRPFMKSKN